VFGDNVADRRLIKCRLLKGNQIQIAYHKLMETIGQPTLKTSPEYLSDTPSSWHPTFYGGI
jgi:hypothetical protein